MFFGSIASGSSGNCAFVGDGKNSLLIDAGISKKRIEEGLLANDVDPREVDGILITHEHTDHIQGLGVFIRKYKTKVFATKETIDYILNVKSLGKLDADLFCAINKDESFKVGAMCINPFSISHDAANPVGYRIECEGKKVALATDMGEYDDYIINNLKGIDAGIIEANHDVNMLMVGSYPYYLKQRILGKKGHLSNESSGRLIDKILHDNIKNIFLGHISKENNYEKLAFEAVKNEINVSSSKYKADDFNITIAKRDSPSRFVEV